MPLELRLTRIPGEELGQYDIYSDPEEIRLEHPVDCSCQRKWDNFNYTLNYHHGKLTIKEPDRLVASVAPAEKIYGEANPDTSVYTISYTLNDKPVKDISKLGLVGTPTFTTLANAKSPVGDYTVALTGISSTLYDNLEIQPTKLTIKPRPMTVTGIEGQKTYGEADPVLTYKIRDDITGIEYANGTDPAARVNPGDLAGNIGREPGEDARVYLTTLGTLADDPNYALTNIAARYQIFCSWALVGIMDDYYKYEGDPNPQFTAYFFNLTGDDTPEEMSEHLIFKTDCDENSPPGKYLVTPWFSEFGYKEENYGWNFVTTNLYVQERPAA